MPGFTQITIDTARLHLRWLDQRDVFAHYGMFSDPELLRYWSSEPWTELAQAEDSIRQTLDDYASGGAIRLGIVLRESGELIGNCALYHFFPQNRRADTGYILTRPHWGKGYLIEAMTALLNYGFEDLDLNRVEADIDPRNTASAKALERLKFRKEGYMRERWIVGGEVCDTAFYGLLRSDWRAG